VYTKASHKGNRYGAVHQMDTCYINDGGEVMVMKRGTKQIKQEQDQMHT
jgi:hypothetical protein